jgi:hypothetical protein
MYNAGVVVVDLEIVGLTPRVDPTIVSYNAVSSLVRFENNVENNVVVVNSKFRWISRGPILTSPRGMNLVPRGELGPLGRMFTPSFTPRGEHSLLFRRMEGRTENFALRGQTLPLGDNFAHGVKVCP